jgi:Uma2 family endonuclease
MFTATATPVTYGHDTAFPKFSVARYQRMIESGILTPDDKVELLENYLVLKMPRNPPHDSTIQRMLRPLLKVVPTHWDVRVQSAIALADSQPEPDFAIVRGSSADYVHRHPSPTDIGVVIEVADAWLLRDQRDKTRIYGRADVPCYWIVNLVDRRIEVYWQPTGPVAVPGYQSDQAYRAGDLVPISLDGQIVAKVAVADILA